MLKPPPRLSGFFLFTPGQGGAALTSPRRSVGSEAWVGVWSTLSPVHSEHVRRKRLTQPSLTKVQHFLKKKNQISSWGAKRVAELCSVWVKLAVSYR